MGWLRGQGTAGRGLKEIVEAGAVVGEVGHHCDGAGLAAGGGGVVFETVEGWLLEVREV